MLESNYQIAGLFLHVDADSPPDLFGRRAERFRVGEKPPDVRYRLRTIAADALTLPPLGARATADLASRGLCRCRRLSSPLLQARLVRDHLEQCLAQRHRISVDLTSSIVTIVDLDQRETSFYRLPQAFSRLGLRGLGPGLLTPFMPVFSSVMLHAAAVVRGDRAAIFLGSDAAGKTTVARTAERAAVLSDDQVVVRCGTGAHMVHGTPWGLLTDPVGSAPAAGLFLLQQADEFQLAPLSPRSALETMWPDHWLNRSYLPRGVRAAAFDMLLELIHNVPAYRMRFPRDYVDWDAIDAAMEAP